MMTTMTLSSAMERKNVCCMWVTSATLSGLADVKPTSATKENMVVKV